MKQVFTNSSVIPCDLVKSVLEAEGISATIKNELGSAAAGYSLPILKIRRFPGHGRKCGSRMKITTGLWN